MAHGNVFAGGIEGGGKHTRDPAPIIFENDRQVLEPITVVRK
jgi:hypothetical protein